MRFRLFRAKTLFVIGAGASYEVDLPVGAELLQQIVRFLSYEFEWNRPKSGDIAIFDALKLIFNEGGSVTTLNRHLIAGARLTKSAQQALSIDNVIDALEDPEVELIGKLGIARSILGAESTSGKFRPNREDGIELEVKNFSNTWYSSLTKLLTEGVKRSSVGTIFDNVEIINFNYDRCLEHYLPFSLSNYYDRPLEDMQQLLHKLKIHRPYGVVGRLPWMSGLGPTVRFGDSSARSLAAVAQQIRTFTEQVEDGTARQSMQAAVRSADRIIFLGFAFHRQNVELIASEIQRHTQVIATSFGISASDRAVIKEELSVALEYSTEPHAESRADLATMTCNDFFNEYWRTLTAEAKNAVPLL